MPTLHTDFLMPDAWNPPLFIEGGGGTFCFYWYQILALDSNWKDPNRWFKVVIMNYQIFIVKGYLCWPLWASVTAIVVSMNRKELYQGMIKC